MESPFPIAFIFQCFTASLIGQSGSFALPAILLPSPWLEEPSSGQSHNLKIIIIITKFLSYNAANNLHSHNSLYQVLLIIVNADYCK